MSKSIEELEEIVALATKDLPKVTSKKCLAVMRSRQMETYSRLYGVLVSRQFHDKVAEIKKMDREGARCGYHRRLVS